MKVMQLFLLCFRVRPLCTLHPCTILGWFKLDIPSNMPTLCLVAFTNKHAWLSAPGFPWRKDRQDGKYSEVTFLPPPLSPCGCVCEFSVTARCMRVFSYQTNKDSSSLRFLLLPLLFFFFLLTVQKGVIAPLFTANKCVRQWVVLAVTCFSLSRLFPNMRNIN